jgi:hypothetical protein
MAGLASDFNLNALVYIYAKAFFFLKLRDARMPRQHCAIAIRKYPFGTKICNVGVIPISVVTGTIVRPGALIA